MSNMQMIKLKIKCFLGTKYEIAYWVIDRNMKFSFLIMNWSYNYSIFFLILFWHNWKFKCWYGIWPCSTNISIHKIWPTFCFGDIMTYKLHSIKYLWYTLLHVCLPSFCCIGANISPPSFNCSSVTHSL